MPVADAAYTETFTYVTTDHVTSASGTVTINVTDTAPVASDATYSMSHDQTFDIDLSNSVTLPDGGSVQSTTIVSGPSDGQLMQTGAATYEYTPSYQWLGADTFTYTASDGIDTSETATITINVTDAAPVAVDDAYGVHPESATTVSAFDGVLQPMIPTVTAML